MPHPLLRVTCLLVVDIGTPCAGTDVEGHHVPWSRLVGSARDRILLG
jgi:hypothetical protein